MRFVFLNLKIGRRPPMSNMELLRLLVYFGAGIVQDFIFTMHVRYVVKKKIIPAVACSFLTVFASMIILYNILKDLDYNRNMLAIFVYSCGIAMGTYLAMIIPNNDKTVAS
jgi:NhaP-type Na+/H+ and K+/H+ antiporter